MKRVVSLLAVVCLMSSWACAGDEAWQGPGVEPGSQSQAIASDSVGSSRGTGINTGDGGTTDGGTSTCVPFEIPTVPTVSEPINLDTWDFASTPLMPVTSTTHSMYLVAFPSPVDSTRIYVYGVDVASQHFIFAGSLAKRYVPNLMQRVGIDIGRFQAFSSVSAASGVSIQIEGPAPPPPPPNITDPGIFNYAKVAWNETVMHDQVFQAIF